MFAIFLVFVETVACLVVFGLLYHLQYMFFFNSSPYLFFYRAEDIGVCRCIQQHIVFVLAAVFLQFIQRIFQFIGIDCAADISQWLISVIYRIIHGDNLFACRGRCHNTSVPDIIVIKYLILKLF